jgi:hypothetical protein
VTPRIRPVGLALALCAGLAAPSAAQESGDTHELNAVTRFFLDSDKVAVRSFIEQYTVPLRDGLGFTVHWNNERVVVPAVAAPPGSQDAVDAITTASRPISGNAYQDFVKVRNEFTGTLARRDVSLEYYHSVESDYLARQVAASWNRDFQDDQFNVALGTSWGWDDIEPLANDRQNAGADRKTTLHWNAVATQVLGPTTVLRGGVEMNQVSGLQHNPYRRVYAGGTNVPERHPDRRWRRDAFLKLNQWFDNRSSVRADYRFYTDDWGVHSHETSAKLSQYLTQGVYAQYDYRWYTQTAADFWQPEYAGTTGVDGFLTGDYRLGPLSSHLFGIALNFDLGVLASESKFLRRLNVSLDYERYFNSNNYSADILETGIDFRF